MSNWKRLFLLFLLLNLFVIPVAAEEAPIGHFADKEQLIGYWELVQPPAELAADPFFNPGTLPLQWFAFYDNGKMVSIKTSDPLRKVTPKDLDSLLTNPNQAASFIFSNGFVKLTGPGEAIREELYGVNIVTRKAVLGNVFEVLPGDLIMSLDGGGKVISLRHLRRIYLSESEYDAGISGSSIKSVPYATKNGETIPAAEREMIRALVPYFTAVSTKDPVTMKKLFPGMRSRSDDQLCSLPVKDYTFHGLENVSYDGSRLRAVVVYSLEMVIPGTIGRNIAPVSADVHLALENGSWVIVGWFQLDENSTDMEYYKDIFSRQQQAAQRYGTTDLAKWDGL
jgi:hypothetical protein